MITSLIFKKRGHSHPIQSINGSNSNPYPTLNPQIIVKFRCGFLRPEFEVCSFVDQGDLLSKLLPYGHKTFAVFGCLDVSQSVAKHGVGHNPPGANPRRKPGQVRNFEIPPCYLAHFQAPLSNFQCLVCT